MKLYSYPKSTTSFRVRAALNLKEVSYDIAHVDLPSEAQKSNAFAATNPSKGVPALVLDDGTVLTQSLAIIDYLDAIAPAMPMLSGDPVTRAKMLSLALIVATDIHPVNNLRVIGQLKQRFDANADQCKDWMQYWMIEGFDAAESILPDDSDFAYSDTPALADLCITAQVYNAHRWGVDLTPFPKISRIERACLAIPAIARAHPDHEPTPKDDQ